MAEIIFGYSADESVGKHFTFLVPKLIGKDLENEMNRREHSGAEFSHSLCPECAKRLYPEFYDEIKDEE